MKTNRILFYLITVLLFVASCSKKALDEVNRNRNNPADVLTKYILTDVMTASAFSTSGGDASLYASVYVEHEAGVHNQTYNADRRDGEPTSATTYNNVWTGVYNNILRLKIAINKTSETGSEAGNDITNGMAKVLLAYNLGVLTDLYGDVPFTESGELNEFGTPVYLQPKIDKQSDIYVNIQSLLDDGIAKLAGSDAAGSGSMGAQDLFYQGDKAKWTKAAYALKARYAMHQLNTVSNKTQTLEDIVSWVDKAFVSSAEELKFIHYDGTQNKNPLFAYFDSRLGIGVSKSLATKFKELNDPRGDNSFIDIGSFDLLNVDQAIADGAPNGQAEQAQQVYPISIASYAPKAPTQLVSYHEIQFLKAEALARLNRTSEASSVLEKGVLAAFASTQKINSDMGVFNETEWVINLSPEVAKNYFDDQVLVRFEVNPLKEIMLQKYLAFFGASGESTEAYNDVRRLRAADEDFINLVNPNNTNKFPLRFSYGNSDVLANQAIKSAYGDGSYVYTENVWWAGGSR